MSSGFVKIKGGFGKKKFLYFIYVDYMTKV
jgi:hypothetical protein